ncbi:hypothetical protein [Streptomyces sp. NPDC005955]|uniref:hypothetical protein n=1 Tax=Streptomyces sp. NPDC005955 TaxID=3364738 RepID=UPI0036C3AE49
MDPEIAALASTAGTTIVALLVTDAWQTARDRVAALWQRARPERTEAVVAELEAARGDLLLAADADGDEVAKTQEELAAEWQARVRRLLTAEPEMVAELRLLLAELAPEAPGVVPVNSQRATASGNARVYQAGRDMRWGQQ